MKTTSIVIMSIIVGIIVGTQSDRLMNVASNVYGEIRASDTVISIDDKITPTRWNDQYGEESIFEPMFKGHNGQENQLLPLDDF